LSSSEHYYGTDFLVSRTFNVLILLCTYMKTVVILFQGYLSGMERSVQ